MNEDDKQKNEKQRCWSAVFISTQSFTVVLCSTRIEEVVMRSDVYEGGSWKIILQIFRSFFTMFSSLASKTSLFRATLVGVSGVGCCLIWKSTRQNNNCSVGFVHAKSADHGHQTRRKTRFDQFASIEVDGQYLMSPSDFLESVMHRDSPGDWLTVGHTHFTQFMAPNLHYITLHYIYITLRGGRKGETNTAKLHRYTYKHCT